MIFIKHLYSTSIKSVVLDYAKNNKNRCCFCVILFNKRLVSICFKSFFVTSVVEISYKLSYKSMLYVYKTLNAIKFFK